MPDGNTGARLAVVGVVATTFGLLTSGGLTDGPAGGNRKSELDGGHLDQLSIEQDAFPALILAGPSSPVRFRGLAGRVAVVLFAPKAASNACPRPSDRAAVLLAQINALHLQKAVAVVSIRREAARTAARAGWRGNRSELPSNWLPLHAQSSTDVRHVRRQLERRVHDDPGRAPPSRTAYLIDAQGVLRARYFRTRFRLDLLVEHVERLAVQAGASMPSRMDRCWHDAIDWAGETL